MRKKIVAMLKDAMRDFPTDHMVQHHADRFEYLIEEAVRKELESLLDAEMIKPEYHNIVVGKIKETA